MYVLDNRVVNSSLHSEALRYKIKTIEQYCGAISCKLMQQCHT